jgi:hypothetical protein
MAMWRYGVPLVSLVVIFPLLLQVMQTDSLNQYLKWQNVIRVVLSSEKPTWINSSLDSVVIFYFVIFVGSQWFCILLEFFVIQMSALFWVSTAGYECLLCGSLTYM